MNEKQQLLFPGGLAIGAVLAAVLFSKPGSNFYEFEIGVRLLIVILWISTLIGILEFYKLRRFK